MIGIDLKDGNGILVWLQTTAEQVHPAGIELLGEAKRLSQSGKQKSCPVMAAAATGEKQKLAEQINGYPAEKVYIYEVSSIDRQDNMVLAQILIEAVKAAKPAIVLVPSTSEGRSIAPRAAAAFRTGITADCTRLELTSEDKLLQIRPAFGGNVMAEIETPFSHPQMATVRPGIFSPPSRDYPSPVWSIEMVDFNTDTRIHILESIPLKKVVDLSSFERVIAIGGGIRVKEDLEYFQKLADYFQAGLGCSRSLVERGWMKPEQQIGLSGSVVRPKLLLCLGISGSVQFLAGAEPDYMVAVNTDPQAPIFQKAHCPIISEMYQVAEAILALSK